jgi:hypothetical protein
MLVISRQAENEGTSAPVHGAAVNSFFMIFVHHQDAPGPPTAYRGGDGNVVVYDSWPEADAVAAELLATKSPNISFTVTEFQPCD